MDSCSVRKRIKKNFLDKKPLVVYWSTGLETGLSFNATMSLISNEPPSVIKDLLNDSSLIYNQNGGNYRDCPAFVSAFKNYFLLTSPIDIDLSFENNYQNQWTVSGRNAEFFKNFRSDTYSNRLSFDLKLDWIFCSEESVVIKHTPPFSHKTAYSDFGTNPIGQFDISKWFRTMSPSYMLWPGVNNCKIVKGEPISYISFDTPKKIIFKKFMLTQKIMDIAEACGNHSRLIPKLSLFHRYEYFKQSNLKNVLVKEIKNNLLN